MGRSPLRILRVAAIAAIFAGAAHALIMGVRSLALGQFIWSSRDVVWMAPAGYLLVFGALALPLALVAAIKPRWMPQGVAVFVFATAAAFSVALLFPRIHHLASLFVAIGIVTSGPMPNTRCFGRPGTAPLAAGAPRSSAVSFHCA